MFDIFKRGAPVPAESPQERPLLPETTPQEQQPPQPAPEEIPAQIIRYSDFDIEPLYNKLAEADTGHQLIDTRLPLPAGDVSLHAKSDGEHFSLYGTVQLNDEDHAKKIAKKVFRIAKQEALNSDGEIEEYRNAIQVTAPDGSDVLIAQGEYYGQKDSIVVSTGKLKNGYDEYKELFPAPTLSPETFKNTLTHTLGAVALVLDTAYAATYRTRPRDINLHIPSIEKPKQDEIAEANETIVADVNQEPETGDTKISLDDIGGQPKAKEEIRSLAYALSHPETYLRWGTRPPKGVLFEGPPGTGKTLLAKALAAETDASFFPVSVADVTSKWYGEAEKRIKKIFEDAAEAERAVIYFDEMDALTPSRDGDSHEATKRVVSVILQHMDGMSAKDNVLVIASTNRAEAMDAAILRPGRFDQKIAVELPDKDGRKDIFDIHMRRARDLAQREIFADDIDTTLLAAKFEDVSGADIAEIIRRALEQKVREETLSEQESGPVTMDELLAHIDEYAPNKQ